jgi:Cu/Ag efflux pump CusA
VRREIRAELLAAAVQVYRPVIEGQAFQEVPAGYWTNWGGTFQQLESATNRLQLVVPLALFIVFTLLFMMLNNVKDGLLVFTGIPFALAGDVLALALRGIPMSISAAVGFIALSGGGGPERSGGDFVHPQLARKTWNWTRRSPAAR